MRRMRGTQTALAAGIMSAAALLAGCNGKSSSSTETVTSTVTVTEPAVPADTVTITVPKIAAAKIGPGAPKRQVQFGRIKSLKRGEGEYLLRFDPAQYLTGVTASDAAQEDTGSNEVPNDNYVVDEGHRLFTYKVPASAHVTVLADGVEGSPITVAELARLVKGKDPLAQPLFEPLATGVWILIGTDTVRSIDQQYVP